MAAKRLALLIANHSPNDIHFHWEQLENDEISIVLTGVVGTSVQVGSQSCARLEIDRDSRVVLVAFEKVAK